MQRRGLAFFVLALLVVPAAAYPDPGKAPRYFDSDCFADHDWRFVHDFVGLFDEVEGGFAEERACALYELTAAHLVLAAVPDLEGESLEVYALHLFEAWGIGDDERLDGILVLYAEDDGTDSGSGALRIEVGYGLESTIVASIAREAYDGMVELKARQVENGSTPREATAFALAVGTAALADYLIQAYDGGFAPAKSSSNGFGFSDIPWWVWLVVAVVVLSILAGGRRGRGVVFFPPMGRGGGGLGRGGSGGRGGGGFGGGRSGGGGWGGKF